MSGLVLKFDSAGNGHCLYSEIIDLASLGSLDITRNSNVEFNGETQLWEVHNRTGELLYSNPSRVACLAWEQQFFNQ